MAEALRKKEEEVVPQQLEKQAVVVDIKTGFPPLPELVSDCYGNKFCPETGQILFYHGIPRGNLNNLF